LTPVRGGWHGPVTVKSGRGLRLVVVALVCQLTLAATSGGVSFANTVPDQERAYTPQPAVELGPVECRKDAVARPRILSARVFLPDSILAPKLDLSLRSTTSYESRRVRVVGLRRHIPRMSPSEPPG
jgi:hypothetical protein